MKTIKQIADELNVSKQAVYKRYKGKLHTEVYPYVHTENGTVYIDETGESIIKSDFLNAEVYTERIQEPHTEVHTEHIRGYSKTDTEYTPEYTLQKQMFDTLNKTIDMLQQQLDEKGEIIKTLTEALRTEQALHSGSMKQLLTQQTQEQVFERDQEPDQDQRQEHEPEPEQKKEAEASKGVFWRLFKR